MKNFFTTNPIRAYAIMPLLMLLFSLIFSCNKLKDDFDFSKLAKPEWNPEFAFPLVNSTFGIGDIFGDSTLVFIKTNPDNSLSLVYSAKEIISEDAEKIMKIPDQGFDFNQEIPIEILPPPGSSVTQDFDFNFQLITDTSGQRLDEVHMKNGTFQLSGKTDLNRDQASLVMTFHQLVHITSHEPLTLNSSLNNPNQDPWVTFNHLVNLEEYLLDFSGDTTSNEITVGAEFTIYGDENSNLTPYAFDFSIEINDLEFSKLFGYLGNYKMHFKDSININFFEKTTFGGIEVGPGAVDIYITTKNSFGTPITIVADELYVTSGKNSQQVDIFLKGPGEPNIFDIDSPTIGQIGETVITNNDFSENNLGEAFNISPEMFYYDLGAITNYEGDSLDLNFVLDSSRMAVDVEIEFKLFTAIHQFVVEDTLKFDFNQNPDELDYVTFRINTYNGFPLEVDMQLIFTDADFNPLDSLITEGDHRILAAAPVSGPPEYKVTEPAHKLTDITVTSDRLGNIVDAKKMILRASLSTTNSDLVRIYKDYNMQIKIGTLAGVKINDN